MKKLISLSLVLIMALSLVACSGAKTEGADIDVAELGSKIVTDLGITATEMPASALQELYSISADDVASCACYMADGGSFPDEIIIVEATDSDALDRVQQALQSRLDDVLVQSRNYDEENYALAQKCKVMVNGNYVALFVSAQHADMETMFEGAVR